MEVSSDSLGEAPVRRHSCCPGDAPLLRPGCPVRSRLVGHWEALQASSRSLACLGQGVASSLAPVGVDCLASKP
eukprot:298168-Prorocentrum_lima.AAC.1